MIDVTLQLNGVDYSEKLSTYKVTYEVETRDLFTTMDGTEHYAVFRRPIVEFSLMPLTDAQTSELYEILSDITIPITYTDPNAGQESSGTMRVASNLESAFGIKSIDGNRYYKGNVIVLRQRTVL